MTANPRRPAAAGATAAASLTLALALALPPADAWAAIAGSSYSANLSSNPSIRKQQLLCDPDDPYSGSTSTAYDPNVVFLAGVAPVEGYFITSNFDGKASRPNVFVEVQRPNNEASELIRLDELDFYLVELGAKETGYIQVFFQSVGPVTSGGGETAAGGGITVGDPVQPTPKQDFIVEDTDGPAGAVTHSLEFEYLDTVSDETDATYRNYADPGRQNGGRGFQADILTRRDPDTQQITPIPFTGTPEQIDAVVTGDLIVPEPSSLALVGLGAVTLLARRRRS